MKNDLISRKAALDAHCELCPDQYICCPVRNGNKCYGLEVFKRIPPAQPERKNGHWILSDDRDWKTCSECGADVDVSMGLGVFVENDEVSEMCFCPRCGARMDGEKQ